MTESENRIKRHIEQLAQFTATPGLGTTRRSYSLEDKQARTYLKNEMAALGLTVREDAIGNIYGRLEGSKPDLPVVLIGSHFDSVPQGGAFDGPAGVVMGLEIATRFKQQQLKPHYPLEIVALVEEEGATFGRGLVASSVIAGIIKRDDLNTLVDAEGVSIATRMNDAGFDADNVASAVRTNKDIKAFIELHIEQGPVLEDAGDDIGIVDVIVGISQLVITVKGRAGHAGTTPMNMRADALLAASKLIQAIPEFAITAQDNTVATVGKLQVLPNGANVIPRQVIFTVDVRSRNEDKLRWVVDQIYQLAKQSNQNGISVDVEQPLYVSPTRLNPHIFSLLQESSQQLGYKSQVMVSGAGHDAMIFAGITDVGLIFVPSKNGISHRPDEWTDYDQIEKGIDVIFEAVKKLTETEN